MIVAAFLLSLASLAVSGANVYYLRRWVRANRVIAHYRVPPPPPDLIRRLTVDAPGPRPPGERLRLRQIDRMAEAWWLDCPTHGRAPVDPHQEGRCSYCVAGYNVSDGR